jgi:hypothetical protein
MGGRELGRWQWTIHYAAVNQIIHFDRKGEGDAENRLELSSAWLKDLWKNTRVSCERPG